MTAASESFTHSVSFSSDFERMLILFYEGGKAADGKELKKGSSSFGIPDVSHLQSEHFDDGHWQSSATAVTAQ